MKKEIHTKREGFSSSIGVIAAVLGSAVGLGNIWKFPYVTGANGGAAFILVYLLCVALVGLPVMLSEHLIGRNTKSNAVGAFKALEPRRPWFLVGGAGVLSAFLIMAFYTEQYRITRRKATVLTILGIGLLGSTATLSNSVFADVPVFGRTFFDFFDFTTSNILLPVGGIFIALFVGWQWGHANVKREMSNEGQLKNDGLIRVFMYLVKFVVPIAIALVLLAGLNLIDPILAYFKVLLVILFRT